MREAVPPITIPYLRWRVAVLEKMRETNPSAEFPMGHAAALEKFAAGVSVEDAAAELAA